jgi:dTDP-4-dehydrorhamnose 3,5-epimerase
MSKWNDFIITPSTVFNGEVVQYQPSVYREYRGEIWTTYHSEEHPCMSKIENQMSVHIRFSRSYKGVLRGLHWDTKTWKLVQATVGDIYLVVLDVRNQSPTYGKWESFIISERTRTQILIPPGFANGHYALTDCIFHYNLFYNDEYVDTDNQNVVKWNDVRFKMEWPTNNPILSKRDGN